MQKDDKDIIRLCVWFILNAILYFWMFGFDLLTLVGMWFGIPLTTYITSAVLLIICEIYEYVIVSFQQYQNNKYIKNLDKRSRKP